MPRPAPHAAPPFAPTPTPSRGAPMGVIAFAGVLLACVVFLAARGHEMPGERSASMINAVVLLVNAGLVGGAYLLAGFGLGRPVAWALSRIPGVRDAESIAGPRWLQAALGVATMLWLSHALGVLGALSGPPGVWIAWGVVGTGLALLAEQVVRGPLRPERWTPLPLSAVLAAPALAAALVAACSPPGALWLGASSEGGAYDVLGYHLQLPKEWIAAGSRLRPVEHNVYSFLPGYLEAAYLHIGALTRGGRTDGGSFVAGSGLGVISSQLCHACLGALTALLVARLVHVAGPRREGTGRAILPAVVAGASVIGVPWVMVVGSLAYNELGVTAMLAGALLLSLDRSWSAAARGAGVGLLMGIACSIKPTSLFMAAPVAGLALLFVRPLDLRERLVAATTGSLTGLLAMAPWLGRNWLASGNPVFPFARRVFGTGHWSPEQMERYAGAHAFHGGVGERVALLLDADRGALNEQWAVFFPLGVVALAALLARRPTRRLGTVLGAGFALQLVSWLFLTHLQSRFLLPALVPLGIALGLASRELLNWVTAKAPAQGPTADARPHPLVGLAVLVAALVPVSLGAWSWLIFVSQRAGRPNQLLAVGGVEFLTGQAFAAEFAGLQAAERRDALLALPPAPFINYTLPADRAVYFVGGATPLYFLPAGGVDAVVYHTTWDRNTLGDAIRAHPDDMAAWTAAVRGAARGPAIGFVLVDFSELGRLYPSDHSRPIWFDPAAKPELIAQWLKQECELVRAWGGGTGETDGVFLFRWRTAPSAETRP